MSVIFMLRWLLYYRVQSAKREYCSLYCSNIERMSKWERFPGTQKCEIRMRMWHVYHPIHSNRYTILYIITHIFMNIITHTIIRIIIYLQITYNVVICEISVQDVYYLFSLSLGQKRASTDYNSALMILNAIHGFNKLRRHMIRVISLI